ncbi:hypothetical protein ACFYE2_02405 [Kocuria sp. CPCC 205300]
MAARSTQWRPVAEGAEPLTKLHRQVWLDMVGELMVHAQETVTT